MRRREWSELRDREITRANVRCEKCAKFAPGRRLDVVILDAEVSSASLASFLVLCRSCRVKRQSPAAQAKAQVTKRARRAQLRLPLTRTRSRSRAA